MLSRPTPQRALTFEYLMWLFIRISALGLYLLVIIGVVAALFMGARTQMDMATLIRWTFFPNPNHVINSNIPDLDLGWVGLLWQVIQGLAVFLGVTHGVNGLRNILEDFIGNKSLRLALRLVLFSLWAFMIYLATVLILTS
jgi:succinate dehydrogenase / fumarate reductase membrane anchor subunit